MDEEHWLELKVEVGVLRRLLEIEREASRWTLTFLALSLIDSSAKLDRMRRVFGSGIAMLQTRDENDVAGMVQATAARIEALGQEPGLDPVKALIVMAALQEDAGRERLAALLEWWSTATPEEIAEEIAAWFRERPPPGVPD
jgi:hypothetical protein